MAGHKRMFAVCLWVMRVGLVLGMINAAVGAGLILWVDVESVITMGPVILLLGLLVLVTSLPCRIWLGSTLGASMIAIALLFFGLVLLLNWGPDDAQMPFATMSVAYVVVFTPFAWIAMTRPAPTLADEPGRCGTCGYWLYGLSGDTCPECGERFDPSTVPATPLHHAEGLHL